MLNNNIQNTVSTNNTSMAAFKEAKDYLAQNSIAVRS